MKKYLMMALFMAAAAFAGCGIEDKGQNLPDAVADNTPAPDQGNDTAEPDVPLTDTTPEVEPDEGIDVTTPDNGADMVEPDVTTPDTDPEGRIETPCIPQCLNKACGDDGCGGECGTCPVFPCKGAPQCVEGKCVYPQVTCDDGNPCTTEYCDPAESRCVYDGTDCDDGNACTVDSCNQAEGCIHTPKDCDDGNACTTDSCDTATGDCQYTAKVCNDGLVYTDDSCNPETGECEFTVPAGACTKDSDCEDGNPCTHDVCNSTIYKCVHVEVVCDDGDKCTTETCQPAPVGMYEYFCQVAAYKDCDDGDSCTYDDCNPTTGACEHTAVPGCCKSDADCTQDAYCQYGGCVQVVCPSQPECWVYTATNHECQSAVLPEGTTCSKGKCDNAGNCVAVQPTDCNDGDKYTEDWYDPTTGICQHAEYSFAVSCAVPENMVATGRYCEVWIGFGSGSQDMFWLKETGEKVSARSICGSSWTPSQAELNVRVFGPGVEDGPWVGGGYAQLSDPYGFVVPLHMVEHPWANPDNWASPTDGIAWCK